MIFHNNAFTLASGNQRVEARQAEQPDAEGRRLLIWTVDIQIDDWKDELLDKNVYLAMYELDVSPEGARDWEDAAQGDDNLGTIACRVKKDDSAEASDRPYYVEGARYIKPPLREREEAISGHFMRLRLGGRRELPRPTMLLQPTQHARGGSGPAGGWSADVPGPEGTGPLFLHGITFRFPDREHLAKVWAHPRAANSGPRPLIVYLHGNNDPNNPRFYPQLDDSRIHVGKLAGKLIDPPPGGHGTVTPLVVAAPTSRDRPLWQGFDLGAFVDAVVEAVRGQVVIDLNQVSVVGHSGAGCDPDRGLGGIAHHEHGTFRTRADGEDSPGHPLKVFGIADTCITGHMGPGDMGPGNMGRVFNEGLGGNHTTVIYALHKGTGGGNEYSGAEAFKNALGATLRNTSDFQPGETSAEIDSYYTDGEGSPKRISIKMKQVGDEHSQLIATRDHGDEWQEAGAYHGGENPHEEMPLVWTWYALQRFYRATAQDQRQAQQRSQAQPAQRRDLQRQGTQRDEDGRPTFYVPLRGEPADQGGPEGSSYEVEFSFKAGRDITRADGSIIARQHTRIAPEPADPRVWIKLAPSVEFDLSGRVLRTLCDWNAFDATPNNRPGVVLFGLRGCRLDLSYDGSFVPSVKLAEDVFDHRENHCVLGVWRPSTDEVAAVIGSTVPTQGSMQNYIRDIRLHDHDPHAHVEACNMMLTGRYDYHVGNHRDSNDPLHLKGVFVQQHDILVIRTRRDETYDPSDEFELLDPEDNIHPSRHTDNELFSSEGCQTVAGGGDTAGRQFEHMRHPGWVKFREAAGLQLSRYDPAQDRWPYVYILLTGREARLAAAGADASQQHRLRQGSSGRAVESLQRALQNEPRPRRYTGPVNGVFSGEVAHAWAKRQKELLGGRWDGIVTPDDAAELGFDIATGGPVTPVPRASTRSFFIG